MDNEILDKVKNLLPENSQILYLVDISPKSYGVPIDNLSEYAGVYLEPIARRLTSQDNHPCLDHMITMVPLQSFLRSQELEILFSIPNKSIVKHPVMDYLYENRNMLISSDTFKKYCLYLHDLHYRHNLAVFETTFDCWDFFRNYHVTNQVASQFVLPQEIDKDLVEKVVNACNEFNNNTTPYLNLIDPQVQQLKHNVENLSWKGIVHEGFIDSVILQLYSGETFEDINK